MQGGGAPMLPWSCRRLWGAVWRKYKSPAGRAFVCFTGQLSELVAGADAHGVGVVDHHQVFGGQGNLRSEFELGTGTQGQAGFAAGTAYAAPERVAPLAGNRDAAEAGQTVN